MNERGCDVSCRNRLYWLRAAVIALNNAERHYTSFALVLATAVMCIAILERYPAPTIH
jgi:hypothetical protein